ncbi:hypothetical protein [Thiosulfatihalobacter marinus]|uniref:hypothetical protein n=1 Tax=Thiosulfatihalobacter marinus TaxID=2792481 RepID=UPI001E5A370B|nr:hypothetical protein [Thiosulfatihalobacter marinus]
MSGKTETAPADKELMPDAKDKKQKKAPARVEGVKLGRHPLSSDRPGHPYALFKGQAPAIGKKMVFTMPNGVTYEGTVEAAVEADGEVLVEFKDGLKPVPAKK